MAQIHYEHPLVTPSHHVMTPQNARGYDASFSQSLTVEEAVAYLEEECNALDSQKFTIYSNYQGLNNPRLRRQLGNDSAVSIKFTYHGHDVFLVCDKWYPVEHNLYALHITLRNLRQLPKWGVVSYEQLIQGISKSHTAFSAPPMTDAAGPSSTASWMDTLGLGPTATLEDANAVYRRRAKAATTEEELAQLNHAIEMARKHFR